MKPPRIAIYTRVSTRDKGQSTTLQTEEIHQYLARTKWATGATITTYDEQESAVKTRPVFDSLIRACQRNQIDVVIVWKLDRAFRSMRDSVLCFMELERLNIRFIAITQGIDTGDDSVMGKLTRNIIMAFAEFERGMIQERVIAGIESARRRGVKFGRKEVPLNDMAWGFIKMAARGEISNHAATKEINALGIGLSRTSIIRKVRAEKMKGKSNG